MWNPEEDGLGEAPPETPLLKVQVRGYERPKPAGAHKSQLGRHLVRNRVAFLNVHKQGIYYPLGSTKRVLATLPTGEQTVIMQQAPMVEFSNHTYSTDDMVIARAMVENRTNFNQRWGYSIDPACLPEALRAKFSVIGTENRRSVMLCLIDGGTAEDALGVIEDEDFNPEHTVSADGQHRCPECGLVPTGKDGTRLSGGAAVAALFSHISIMHPDYKGAEAS